ncbi:hypothetical protein NDU88_001432 [Pleurodeles waltl]|uniref:Uncharacterized protein n=1 Tax=Pleurodeles waltl TaxID=8319 RepID=A0AAV7WLH2_PLEWA|nr:hypothetical protein NDU88_001432 [Pleurodeles waltl]
MRTGRSAGRTERRRRCQQEDNAVQRIQPNLGRNRREVQEERRSEQTAHALGRDIMTQEASETQKSYIKKEPEEKKGSYIQEKKKRETRPVK